MEKAFEWNEYECKILDDAFNRGNYGKGRFVDDWGEYVNVLRNLVEKKLREKSQEKQMIIIKNDSYENHTIFFHMFHIVILLHLTRYKLHMLFFLFPHTTCN